MNRHLRALLVILLLAGSTQAPCAANYQDMWWRPSESGWGVMVLQQGEVISAVMFHYRPDRKPIWYLLSSAPRGSGEVYTGTLYEVSGPPLFGAFDPNTVDPQPVGTMTLTFNSLTSAHVDYTIGNQTDGKDIQRITFRTLDTAGNYIGALAGYATCPGFPGIDRYTFPAEIVVGTTPPVRVTLGSSLVGSGFICDFSAAPVQSGGIYTGQGTWTCKDTAGVTQMTAAYVIDEMRLIDKTLVMNFHANTVYPTANNASCSERGTFSGVKR